MLQKKFILTEEELNMLVYSAINNFWLGVCPHCERDINMLDYVGDSDINLFIDIGLSGEANNE